MVQCVRCTCLLWCVARVPIVRALLSFMRCACRACLSCVRCLSSLAISKHPGALCFFLDNTGFMCMSCVRCGLQQAINEGSNGLNLSSGLWYPPKSYYLEGDAGSSFQPIASHSHKTGETCGSVFWVKLNQRFHYQFPTDERYVAEIERSLLNVGVANQAPGIGSTLAPHAGIRSFALLHGHKNNLQNISTCCEGQVHPLIPSLILSHTLSHTPSHTLSHTLSHTSLSYLSLIPLSHTLSHTSLSGDATSRESA
jgi:hypothetical protein